MEQIEFIHSIDCRACAPEIRMAPKRKLQKIVQERDKCVKCKGCARLQDARGKLNLNI